MKKTAVIGLIVSGLVLISCSSAPKKESVLDSQWQAKNRSVAYKSFTAPVKWSPGQFVVTGNYSKGKKDSISRTTVVRKENGGWVFETISTSKEGKVTGMQMLIQGFEKAQKTGNGSGISVDWIKMLQDDGTVQLMEGESLVMYNALMKSTWENLVMSSPKYEKGEAVTVPAGVFLGSTKVTATVKVFFKTVTATTYLHPAVPVNGVLKTVSEDGEMMSELLDYGFDGKPFIK